MKCRCESEAQAVCKFGRGACEPHIHTRLRNATFVAALIVSCASPAFAQAAAERVSPAVLLAGGQYGSPTRLTATAGVLIGPPSPFLPGDSPDSSRRGVLLSGGIGTGGYRLGAGGAALALEGPLLTTGLDALFTVTRTTKDPRGAAASSTYIGGEFGLLITAVRVSAGVAHRVAGTSGGKSTVFVWSIGAQVPVGW